MYKKILVAMALDHDVSHATLEIAQKLCVEDGQIIALHVVEEPQGIATAVMSSEHKALAMTRAQELFAEKLKALPNVSQQLVTGRSHRTIVEFAGDNDIDCIVMGSHKPGLGEYILGSTAARVVRYAPCTVHVHRTE